MAVHYEIDGNIFLITLDRPEVANAIDRPTAQTLADAFRRFEADESLAAAMLTGASGRFCAGADLKAIRMHPDRAPRIAPDGDGPLSATRGAIFVLLPKMRYSACSAGAGTFP
jgi:enoyl-CoA hydratase